MAKNARKAATTAAIRNPMAGALAHGAFQPQTLRPRKGKGSYSRKAKHSARIYG